ncbi:hypothetical protein [Polaromonas sp. DSP2-3-2b2]|uniref:hypothetical protein n=1 Tax=Polaromonas sp. DSP2-3-2b2 TaxID=2804662 RepID=UPI003CE7F6A2
MNDPIATGTPKTRQEAYLLDLIGDVVTLDKQICKLHESVLSLGEALPGLANKEMKRAGDQAILALSGQVGTIAQKIAGDAAAVERNNSFVKATVFAIAGLLLCGLLFGGAGLLTAKSFASISVNAAERDLAEANLLLQNEKKRIDEKIVELEKKSADEIARNSAAIGWAATPNGRLAKAFFDTGGGAIAATCNAKYLEKEIDSEKRTWCYAKRHELFGGEDNKLTSAWRIP